MPKAKRFKMIWLTAGPGDHNLLPKPWPKSEWKIDAPKWICSIAKPMEKNINVEGVVKQPEKKIEKGYKILFSKMEEKFLIPVT